MASEIERLVDRIYESVAHPEQWSMVARSLVRCAEAISCSIQLRSPERTSVIGAFGYKALNPEVYEQHFARRDVRAKALMRLPANQTHALHHHLPQRRFVASDYYNDYFRHVTDGFWSSAWWTPIRTPSLPKRSVMAFGVHRPQAADPDDPALGQLFGFVTPHLRHAARLFGDFSDLNGRLEMAQAVLDGLSYPVLVLDRLGRVMDRNRVAEEFFKGTKRIWIDGEGGIAAADRKAMRALRAGIEFATGKRERHPVGVSDVAISDPETGDSLTLAVLPLSGRSRPARSGALLTIRRLGEKGCDAMARGLAARFHLTPAEERLVRLLVDGRNLEQAADSLEIQRSTAATQLRSIFSKTGTHRQGELISLAFSMARLSQDSPGH